MFWGPAFSRPQPDASSSAASTVSSSASMNYGVSALVSRPSRRVWGRECMQGRSSRVFVRKRSGNTYFGSSLLSLCCMAARRRLGEAAAVGSTFCTTLPPYPLFLQYTWHTVVARGQHWAVRAAAFCRPSEGERAAHDAPERGPANDGDRPPPADLDIVAAGECERRPVSPPPPLRQNSSSAAQPWSRL